MLQTGLGNTVTVYGVFCVNNSVQNSMWVKIMVMCTQNGYYTMLCEVIITLGCDGGNAVAGTL